MNSDPAVQTAGLCINKGPGFEGGNGDQFFNATFQQQLPPSSSYPTTVNASDSVIPRFDGMTNVTSHIIQQSRTQQVNSLPVVDYTSPPPAIPSLMDDLSHVTSPYLFTSMSTPRLDGEVSSTLGASKDVSSPLQTSRVRSPSHISSPYRSASAVSTATVAMQEDVGGTTYFYTHEDITTQQPVIHRPVAMPQYTVYPGTMPHVAHMKLLKSKSGVPSFFMPDELKLEILNRQVFTVLQLDSSHNADRLTHSDTLPQQLSGLRSTVESNSGLPVEVDNYHKLYPLELTNSATNHIAQKSSTFGYQTSVYKAVNTKDGLTYCLRRIHGYRLVNARCMTGIELWKKILHPNLVHLREVFTTKAFGDHSMVFVYDYHPGSETLMSRHFGSTSVSKTDVVGYGQMPSASPKFRNHGNDQMLTPSGTVQLPEALIWTYIVQLSSVLRTIHGHGLACRVMDPTKILLVDKTRIRLNCVGVFDIVNFDANLQSGSAQMERYKQEDLTSLGRVVLALANNSVQCLQTPAAAVAFVSRNYSSDLKNLILYLMTPQPHARNINDVMPMIGARFYSQLEATHLRNDILEQALSQEVENGRLFKLLCKLGTINERPEYSMDVSWSETGDRYMLKLFRDYLFHQVDASGAPWLDMAHIIQSLNKLNAGVPEKICLSSRDDDIIVLVSYAELKRCIESSFNELTSAAAAAATRDGRAASTVGSYS